MTSKKRIFLDASAWLSFLEGKSSAAKVTTLLEREDCFTSLINYYEVLLWYQHRKPELMSDVSKQVSSHTTLVSIDEPTVFDALRWKRSNPDFSMADALSYASAIRMGALFVTSDPDFEKVGGVIFLR